jgi:ATP synthase protein I
VGESPGGWSLGEGGLRKPQDTNDRPANAGGVTGDLASRIASAKREREREDDRASPDNSRDMSVLARGMRIGTEFMAAILVGAGIGYLIDLGLGTSPWGLLILLMVGFAAGILNVIRVVAEMNAASPAPPGSDLGPEADDDQRDDK